MHNKRFCKTKTMSLFLAKLKTASLSKMIYLQLQYFILSSWLLSLCSDTIAFVMLLCKAATKKFLELFF